LLDDDNGDGNDDRTFFDSACNDDKQMAHTYPQRSLAMLPIVMVVACCFSCRPWQFEYARHHGRGTRKDLNLYGRAYNSTKEDARRAYTPASQYHTKCSRRQASGRNNLT